MIEIKQYDYTHIDHKEFEWAGTAQNLIKCDYENLWVCSFSNVNGKDLDIGISFTLSNALIQELKALVMVIEKIYEAEE